MTILPDRDIRRRLNSPEPIWNKNRIPCVWETPIGISPCEDHQVQPASIDLTLADEWLIYPVGGEAWVPGMDSRIDIDRAKEIKTDKIVSKEYTLYPHRLLLCSTAEYVEIPDDIQAQVHGKSSLGRLGLMVHITAGFIDPGFKGKITLEMYNLNDRPIILRAGKPICQISFTRLTCPAEFPYGHERLNSKYQDQREVVASKYDGYGPRNILLDNESRTC